MSTSTAERVLDPTLEPAAPPLVDETEAQSLGLMSVTDAADDYGVAPATLRRWLARTGTEPVARLVAPQRGPHRPLFTREQISAAARHRKAAATPVEKAPLSGPRRVLGLSPARIGLRTPTAGKPYKWRDPARWR